MTTPENPLAPNDASFQTSGGGPGGVALDLTKTTQVATGAVVFRERVVPGGDDGTLQSFPTDPATVKAAVIDLDIKRLAAEQLLETRRVKNLLRLFVGIASGKTFTDEELDGLDEGVG